MKILFLTLSLALASSCSGLGTNNQETNLCQLGKCRLDKSCCHNACEKCDGKSSCKDSDCHSCTTGKSCKLKHKKKS